jgi:RNA polymerase sigma factor (sigma-70 family)
VDFQKKYPENLTDREYWSLLQDGCKKSLEFLYFRHYDKLYKYALSFCGNRELAEDHIQSLFLKIWERREGLGDVEYVKTYLWVSLRRSLIDTQKVENRFKKVGIDFEVNDFRLISSAEEIILFEERKNEVLNNLYDAIQELNPRQKEILYLKFFEGMSYQEIEEITSLKYQSVRNYIYEAIKILKSTLQENDSHQEKQLNLTVIFGLWVLFSISI